MGRTSALINLLVPAFVVITGLALAVLFPRIHAPAGAVLLPFFVCLTGGALILVSKVPRLASGRWVSFGAAGLPLWARVSYYSGYALLALGSLAALASWAAFR